MRMVNDSIHILSLYCPTGYFELFISSYTTISGR
jgi:hypothetical protein